MLELGKVLLGVLVEGLLVKRDVADCADTVDGGIPDMLDVVCPETNEVSDLGTGAKLIHFRDSLAENVGFTAYDTDWT